MFRFDIVSLVGLLLIALIGNGYADPQDEKNDRIQKTLALQTALAQARVHLTDRQSQKAVEILEQQLPHVNGNNAYLIALRQAYRAYIMDLYFAGQPEQARRYHERLCIIDPSAANDRALQPQQPDPEPRKFEPDPPKQAAKLPFPLFKLPSFNIPFAKRDEKGPPTVKLSMARGVSDDAVIDDPFAVHNRREAIAVGPSPVVNPARARDLLMRGADEFRNERYAEARHCFEQAYQADQSTLPTYKTQWAYCIIKGVADVMEQPGVLPARLPELKQQVEGAIGMSPGNFMAVGQQLLERLEQKAKHNAVLPRGQTFKIKHWGKNEGGWLVAETPHFHIFHRKDNDFAERVARIAEHTRLTMYRKWFNSDGHEWQPVCDLILHANGADYTHMTGVQGNSPGHSRIESDPSGRVIDRRMDLRLDIPRMMDDVLPHETTHVVLAGMFGNAPVPRWADEGIAVLSEPDDKVNQHRQNLLKHHKDGLLFGLKQLMELKDYPHPRQISAFYAQSVVLVEFLTHKRGPKTLTDFVKDSVHYGYDTSLQRHYGLTFAQLEQEWRTQIIDNPQRLAATK